MTRWHLSEIGVEALPSPCRECVFWEAGGLPGPELSDRERATARVSKESWWQATCLEWGPCGLGAWHGDRLAGYATIAPGHYLKGAARFGRVTEDAFLLATLWTAPDVEQEEVAGALVEAALRMVAARGAQALEAFVSPSGDDPCVPGEDLLRACGFDLIQRRFPYPHYRLDLRQTARWREGIEEALVGVRRLLRGRGLGRVPSLPSALAGRER